MDENGKIIWANLVIATGQNNNAMNLGVAQAAKHYIKDGKFTEGILERVEAVVRTLTHASVAPHMPSGRCPWRSRCSPIRVKLSISLFASRIIGAPGPDFGTWDFFKAPAPNYMTIYARRSGPLSRSRLWQDARGDDGVGPWLAEWVEQNYVLPDSGVRVLIRQTMDT